MDILSAVLTLLLIMDPLGNIPLFLSVLKTIENESRKRKILIRELFFALLVLLLFLFAGEYLLQWLNLRQEAVSIAGGIVLFLISLRMIFPSEKGIMGEMPEGEPFFVPLAVPLLAGPSTLAMLILLARSQPERIYEWLATVLAAWVVTSLIMLSSSKLSKLFGKRGLIALERLMDMVLVAISVQMLMDGMSTYLNVMTIR
jgi:multiple antibiotic resistance protein